jgi:hypothetical protein
MSSFLSVIFIVVAVAFIAAGWLYFIRDARRRSRRIGAPHAPPTARFTGGTRP